MDCARQSVSVLFNNIARPLYFLLRIYTGEDAPRQRGEMSATLASAFPNLRHVRRQLIFGHHFAKFGTAKSPYNSCK